MLNSSSSYRNIFHPQTAFCEFTLLCVHLSASKTARAIVLWIHTLPCFTIASLCWQALSGQSFLLCCFLIDCILRLSEILDVKPYDKSHVKLRVQSWGVVLPALWDWVIVAQALRQCQLPPPAKFYPSELVIGWSHQPPQIFLRCLFQCVCSRLFGFLQCNICMYVATQVMINGLCSLLFLMSE